MVSAAATLGIDHTTVSRRLRRLEQDLGARLLNNGSDGWVLTETGRRIVDEIHPLEALLGRVHDVVDGGANPLRGTVRVSAPDGFGASFLAPAIARVTSENPDVRVELVTSMRPLTGRASGFDMSVSIGTPPTDRLSTERLAAYALRLYQSRDHAARHDPIGSMEDLRKHSLVFYVDALLSIDELNLLRHFAGTRVGFASTNVHAQVAATKASAGIGLLPCFLASREPDLVPVLPDEVTFDLQFSLSLQPDSTHLELITRLRRSFFDEVEQRAHELRPPL